MKTLLATATPQPSAGCSIAPDPENLDSLILAAARVLDAHMLAVTALLEMDHDCTGCMECTTVYVLEHLRETALDQVAAVLIGLGLYRSDEESDAYAEALERAETLAAERAADRLTMTANVLAGLPEDHESRGHALHQFDTAPAGAERCDSSAESATYAEALERAETAVADEAAAQMPWEATECSSTSLTVNLAGGLPQRHDGATTPSSREAL